MSKPAHTPGPWVLEEYLEYLDDTDEGCFRMRRVISEKNRATVVSDEYGLSEADARLISSGPDLLAAAKEARDCLMLYFKTEYAIGAKPALEMLEAAIKKAEGTE